MSDIIEKLNTLKSVQPSEKLVVEMREEVLSKAPVFCNLEHNYTEKSIFSLNNLFARRMAVSFAVVAFVLTGGLSVSYASRSSLPGDTLYSVKIASEGVQLAISSGDRKAEIEIEQAGKRLEEAVEISKNPSDINQGEKLKKLIVNFEEKINRAQSGLMEIEDNEKKAKIAKVINIQTEKYTEVLATTSENLTDVVKNDVSEKFASATDSNKKVNLDSLAVRIEVMTDEDKDEITAIVKEKVEKEVILEEETTSNEVDLDIPADDVDADSSSSLNDANADSSSDEEDLSSSSSLDDVSDTEGETEEDSEISSDIVGEVESSVEEEPTMEERKEVLTNLLDTLNDSDETIVDDNSDDDGEVKGETDSSDDEKEEVIEEGDNKIVPVSVF